MKDIENRIKRILFESIKDRNIKVILYGSRARGDAHFTSDFDIALSADAEIDRRLLRYIKEKFEESTIPYKIDIVDMAKISLSLKDEIEKEGILWRN